MAYDLVAFQVSNAIGGLGFGVTAQAASLSTAFLAISGCLVVGLIISWGLALAAVAPTDTQAGEPWPLPQLGPQDDEDDGLVLVTARWSIEPVQSDTFLELAAQLRGIRRRTGATNPRLYHDPGHDDEDMETFLVGSWARA